MEPSNFIFKKSDFFLKSTKNMPERMASAIATAGEGVCTA
jgi:hypothetical protein